VIAERVSVGNLLLLLAVIPAMLTSLHSGRLSLAAGARIPMRTAVIVVAGAGLLLGVGRFDRSLVAWLSVLSVVLVPIMVPMGREIGRRRAGRPARLVRTWVWAPASSAGAVAVLAGWHLALALATALALFLTTVSSVIHHEVPHPGRQERSRR
jgi:cytosine permease